ncbi:MAG: hypothetical protein AAF357_13505, partial [Verrucomicrobiota bacterium]
DEPEIVIESNEEIVEQETVGEDLAESLSAADNTAPAGESEASIFELEDDDEAQDDEETDEELENIFEAAPDDEDEMNIFELDAEDDGDDSDIVEEEEVSASGPFYL